MPFKDAATRREYQRVWVANRRASWLAENGPCVVCQSWENLEVDHRDPKTKVSHRIWSWSKIRLLKELEKCQVLCHEHHVAKKDNSRYGEEHYRAKLSSADIQQIRAYRELNWSYRQIAAQFDVHWTTVQKIVSGQRWAHVQ